MMLRDVHVGLIRIVRVLVCLSAGTLAASAQVLLDADGFEAPGYATGALNGQSG